MIALACHAFGAALVDASRRQIQALETVGIGDEGALGACFALVFVREVLGTISNGIV